MELGAKCLHGFFTKGAVCMANKLVKGAHSFGRLGQPTRGQSPSPCDGLVKVRSKLASLSARPAWVPAGDMPES